MSVKVTSRQQTSNWWLNRVLVCCFAQYQSKVCISIEFWCINIDLEPNTAIFERKRFCFWKWIYISGPLFEKMACMTIMGVSLSILPPSVTWRKNCEKFVQSFLVCIKNVQGWVDNWIQLQNRTQGCNIQIYRSKIKSHSDLTVFSPRDRRC